MTPESAVMNSELIFAPILEYFSNPSSENHATKMIHKENLKHGIYKVDRVAD